MDHASFLTRADDVARRADGNAIDALIAAPMAAESIAD
ncbi:hypothetical protein P3T22_000045 [Paraburkholderia sp. GAS348]|jgi:hypothetical protein